MTTRLATSPILSPSSTPPFSSSSSSSSSSPSHPRRNHHQNHHQIHQQQSSSVNSSATPFVASSDDAIRAYQDNQNLLHNQQSQQHRGGGRGGKNSNRSNGVASDGSSVAGASANIGNNYSSNAPTQRGGGRGGRGGQRGRGGGNANVNQQQQNRQPQQRRVDDGSMSAADAAAIDAALAEDSPVLASASSSSSASIAFAQSSSLPPAQSSSSSPSTCVTRSNSYPSSANSASSSELARSLFSFRYEPTTLQNAQYLNKPGRKSSSSNSSSSSSGHHGQAAAQFSRAQYMQASHHFVVRAGAEEANASFILPDQPIDWQIVEEVVCPTDSSARECPICLSPPIAAKITRCGHIYCQVCIIQYLAMTERSWSRCPLCFDAVYPAALKSVEFRVHNKYHDNDLVDFVLCTRNKDCVNVVPAVSSSSSQSSPFARISRTSDISSIVHRELRELFVLRATSILAKDDHTLACVDLAEQQIVERIKQWGDRYPSWQMRQPTYAQMKIAEQQQIDRIAAEVLKKRAEADAAREAASSIVANKDAWPSLSSAPKSAAATKKIASLAPLPPAPIVASTSTSSDSIGSDRLQSGSNSPSMTSSSSSSSSAIDTQLASLLLTASSSSSSSSSSFFDAAGDSQAEYRFNKAKLEREKLADTASSSSSSSSSLPATLVPPKPGRSSSYSVLSTSPASNASLSLSDPTYHFYQSSDGRQLYLHSLNYRSLLLDCHNDITLLPPIIQCRLVHSDAYIVDSSIRSRFRFLSHLPLTSTFDLALVEMPDGMISPQTKAIMDAEFASERKSRAMAVKRQDALNKRTIQLAASTAAKNLSSSHGHHHNRDNIDAGARANLEWSNNTGIDAFPDLPNPLGYATGVAAYASTNDVPSTDVIASTSVSSSSHSSSSHLSSQSASSRSPDIRGVVGTSSTSPLLTSTPSRNWNIIAEKGMASAEMWAPLASSSSSSSSSSSHWGSSSQPMMGASVLPSSASMLPRGVGWARSTAATASSSAAPKPVAKKYTEDEYDYEEEDMYSLPTTKKNGTKTLMTSSSRRRA